MTTQAAQPPVVEVVELSVRLPLSADRVWPLLTTERLTEWYAFDGATVDLRVGGAMQLGWAGRGRFRAVVQEVAEPTTFAFRLCHVADTDPAPDTSTLVAITVTPEETPVGEISLVRVQVCGFEDLDPALGDTAAMINDEARGWQSALVVLDDVVARVGR